MATRTSATGCSEPRNLRSPRYHPNRKGCYDYRYFHDNSIQRADTAQASGNTIKRGFGVPDAPPSFAGPE